MTIDELKDSLKGVSVEFINEYGPTLLTMSKAELLDLVELIASGKELEAWGQIVAQQSGSEALSEAKAITSAWNEANAANAASIALQTKAITALLGGVLTIALALVGL
jgi:hypothetical protein